MKIQKILFAFAVMALVFSACNKKAKNKEECKKDKIEKVDGNTEKLALNISGMTCEIGCAKMIESKLSKQDGVIDAKVVFTDSIAKIKFDPAKTNKAALMSFVGGIADNMYTATEAAPSCSKKAKECDSKKASKEGCEKTSCDKSKKETSCTNKASKACDAECAKACEKAEKACAESCEMKCCA